MISLVPPNPDVFPLADFWRLMPAPKASPPPLSFENTNAFPPYRHRGPMMPFSLTGRILPHRNCSSPPAGIPLAHKGTYLLCDILELLANGISSAPLSLDPWTIVRHRRGGGLCNTVELLGANDGRCSPTEFSGTGHDNQRQGELIQSQNATHLRPHQMDNRSLDRPVIRRAIEGECTSGAKCSLTAEPFRRARFVPNKPFSSTFQPAPGYCQVVATRLRNLQVVE
ncbi:hypothetical protein C8J56DRAFT_1053539 [Mycena floridula]|nr:hypothetical protein C8J56DRAFT_1053539 [Mycena floridula]